jgi:hypothetical protein
LAAAAAVIALGGSRLGGRGKESARRIIVRRDQLATRTQFAGTLLHELAHAQSGEPDNSLEFEDALTVVLGRVAHAALG